MEGHQGATHGGSLFSTDTTGIYVVVENVRSLFNVGAIFRSADGAGATGLLLTGFTGRPPRREISRVALGAETSVPWRYYGDTVAALDDLRSHGVSVLALETTSDSTDYRTAVVTFPVAFVVGHEVEGISASTISRCDGCLHIPMLGQKRSLNVSVAAGILLYQLASVRDGKPIVIV